MSVTVKQLCQLCGEPLKPFERVIHGLCGINENTRCASQPNAAEQPCQLCGKPTLPGERGVHNDCATIENMRSDEGI